MFFCVGDFRFFVLILLARMLMTRRWDELLD